MNIWRKAVSIKISLLFWVNFSAIYPTNRQDIDLSKCIRIPFRFIKRYFFDFSDVTGARVCYNYMSNGCKTQTFKE